ncbi:hypothetical protein ROU88_11535 [Macrococcus capreoli]|uniref:hypothetical protein n=1 Tax=Macrococcus capreoli TaxID=2982690 RepID=UPI0021D5C45E|nr:hypothetical protein [Macrococcus sp. TMW 2.2395]MCU7557394.1 hypothetical protein [Macrococcus sp. TMW 2.2395]
MSLQMKQLIFLVLGLAEIIAGLSLYKSSQLGGSIFIVLGMAFLSIMYIMYKKDDEEKHYHTK